MSKIIVSLSGGIDSATTLALAIEQGHECFAIAFRYGSKHEFFEINAAKALCKKHFNIPLKIINLIEIMRSFKSNLLISGGEIPESHYEDESMKLTVVPARNMIFISTLTGIAISEGCDEIWLGIHSGDHAIYPDCRPKFIQYLRAAINEVADHKLFLNTPFLNINKTGILKEAVRLNFPLYLTRTCYKNQALACGKCGSCIERLEAFRALDLKDPIEYEKTEWCRGCRDHIPDECGYDGTAKPICYKPNPDGSPNW